jgi:hypothetical protein
VERMALDYVNVYRQLIGDPHEEARVSENELAQFQDDLGPLVTHL